MQDWSIKELSSLLREKKTSSVEITTDYLASIKKKNPEINAFITVDENRSIAQARLADERIQKGEGDALTGVPIAQKDIFCAEDWLTTCGSKMLHNFVAPYDATVVRKFNEVGAVNLGKTNMDEFAMGSSNETSYFGAVKNPWDLTRVPGGSSGGSAAAVSAGFCDAALGSDTGGSIRQPASLCGCVGFKPTYGRISRYGLVAFGSSLDQIGPFAKDVRGCAELFEAMAGRDTLDSTTVDLPVPDCCTQLDEPLRGLRVGVPREYRTDANAPSVARALDEAIAAYKSMGATIVDVELPLTDVGISTYYVIAPAEASSNLARFDGIRYGHRATLEAGEGLEDLYAKSRSQGFGPEVQRRIMLGTYVLSSGYYDAYYNRALQVRRRIREEFDHAFTKCDVLLGPTSPIPAFEIGGKKDPWAMYLCDVYTVNTNIAGIPGISLNTSYAQEGNSTLPIGMQLQGPAFSEALLLRAARMLERTMPPSYPA